MYCENDFCIYQDDRHCILNRIHIDVMGCCSECIVINI